jgi:hypothetical protein
MKIAHLILAHKQPEQLERLIRAMDHPAFSFFIHIDKKADIAPFRYLASRKNVFFIQQRTPIYWAGYGTIQATLYGFAEILPGLYDYINVISAQDFPLQPAEGIYRYICERNGTEFITCENIDTEWQEAAPRVRKYHLVNWRIPGKYRLENLLNRILPARKFPFPFTIVGRANWFTLSAAAARYILDFAGQHPRYIKYFRYCWGADEFFFATILYNSTFKNRIEPNLVYVDWLPGKGHPEIVTTAKLDALKTSGKLFARKFDTTVDARVLDLLEEWIGVKPAPPVSLPAETH